MPSMDDLHCFLLDTHQPSPWGHPRVIAVDDTKVWHVNTSVHIPDTWSMGTIIQRVSSDFYNNSELVQYF